MAINETLLNDAYVYLIARALVVRQEITDLADPDVEYNHFKYNPVGKPIGWVNPNLDVANTEAWVAVDERTPVKLVIPQINGRYYTAQILDEWGETITNINQRTYPVTPFGIYYLVSPDFQGRVPDDGVQITLRSSKAKILARVEIAGDIKKAAELQAEFTLEPTGLVKIERPVPIPPFNNRELLGVEIFDFAQYLLEVPDVSEVAAARQDLVRHFAAEAKDPEARAQIDQLIRTKIVPAFTKFAYSSAGKVVEDWFGTTEAIGVYHDRVDIRAAADLIGIWANVATEVIYFVATKDAEGKPLNGANTYALDFAADHDPSAAVEAYWSLSLVSVPDFVAVPNRLDRYTFNSVALPAPNSDGSFSLYCGPDNGASASGKPIDDAYLLPSPHEGEFSLTFRTYVPKQVVRDGNWFPPAVRKVS